MAETTPKKGTEKKLSPFATRVLLRPRITEKAYAVNALNQYVFQVTEDATKTKVKRAVEEAYGVNVVSVKMIKRGAQKRIFGRTRGTRSALKKAMVRLKAGQSIELFKAGL